MGLIRDTLLLRQYLRAKALSNLLGDLEEGDGKSKKDRKPKRVQKEENTERHLGFWDFLDKRIQEEKKEEQENPTSVKDVLKYIGILLLISLGAYLLLKLVDLFEHWWGTVVTAL